MFKLKKKGFFASNWLLKLSDLYRCAVLIMGLTVPDPGPRGDKGVAKS